MLCLMTTRFFSRNPGVRRLAVVLAVLGALLAAMAVRHPYSELQHQKELAAREAADPSFFIQARISQALRDKDMDRARSLWQEASKRGIMTEHDLEVAIKEASSVPRKPEFADRPHAYQYWELAGIIALSAVGGLLLPHTTAWVITGFRG